MAVTINGTTGIANDGGYTGDGVVFADTTPANTLVTTTGGNVGIGTSSPSAAKLVVRSGTGTAHTVLGNDYGSLYLETASGGPNRITSLNSGLSAGQALAFNGSGGTEWGRFDSSGNLGIGTSSPSQRLDVAGSANFSASATIGWGGSTNYCIQSDNANWFRILTAGAERARIDSSGNLLVGRTSNVSAGARIATTYNANAGNWGMGIQASVQENGTAIGFVNTSGTTVGTISQGPSSTAYNTSSDYRLKHDIQPMTGALARVAALKPVTYKWNVDDSEGEGFIAHELQEVCPSAVTGEKDAVDADGNPQYQGIDTSFLVATLTAAIQEQQAIITALTARVTALEGQP